MEFVAFFVRTITDRRSARHMMVWNGRINAYTSRQLGLGRIIMTKFRMFAGLMLAIMGAFPLSAAPGSVSDLEGPVQVGYVIITPVTSAGLPVDGSSGLVAFETFGEKKGNTMMPTGVLPSSMTMSAMLFVNTSGRLSRDVGVAVANPSGSATNITLTLKDKDGKEVANTEFELKAGNQKAAFVSQMFEKEQNVPQDFTGSLVISSSEIRVAMMGLRSRGENYSTLPLTTLGFLGVVPSKNGAGGIGAIILPQFAVGGGWESEIVLVNSDPSNKVYARVDLFKPDGSPLEVTLNGVTDSSFKDIAIPPGGVYVLARRDQNGDSEF
jgi:hypothetical protein